MRDCSKLSDTMVLAYINKSIPSSIIMLVVDLSILKYKYIINIGYSPFGWSVLKNIFPSS